VITSARDRIFCSGANIYMLGSSTHAFKVNFCKFTNETRLALEDASAHSGLRSLAAVNGACAGGGYELALACDEILLVDDSSSAVSLPEVSLLAVLPGTGGLTRVTDKRRVRRDLADVFSSLGEGVKGRVPCSGGWWTRQYPCHASPFGWRSGPGPSPPHRPRSRDRECPCPPSKAGTPTKVSNTAT
jgi:benzoyl-CoA-dihydrodiol lyase